MVEPIAEGLPRRASGQLGLHVLQIADAVLCSAAESRALTIGA